MKREKKELKLNLACGDHKIEGFLGVDYRKAEATEKIHNLTRYPWPWKDGTVSEIECNYYFNYLDGHERIAFMGQCWRVLKDEGKLVVKVPYWTSVRAITDPLVKWPPLCELSFVCFNKEWREQNRIAHYPITCDFDFGYGFGMSPELVHRNDDYRRDAIRLYNNTVLDLIVTMTKRPHKPAKA